MASEINDRYLESISNVSLKFIAKNGLDKLAESEKKEEVGKVLLG